MRLIGTGGKQKLATAPCASNRAGHPGLDLAPEGSRGRWGVAHVIRQQGASANLQGSPASQSLRLP